MRKMSIASALRELHKNDRKYVSYTAIRSRVHEDSIWYERPTDLGLRVTLVDVNELMEIYPQAPSDWIGVSELARKMGISRQGLWYRIKERGIQTHLLEGTKRARFIDKKDISKLK